MVLFKKTNTVLSRTDSIIILISMKYFYFLIDNFPYLKLTASNWFPEFSFSLLHRSSNKQTISYGEIMNLFVYLDTVY